MTQEHENVNTGTGTGGAGLVGLVIIGLLLWWGYNSFLKSDTWQAMYETSSQTAVGVGPKFDNKEECLGWINHEKRFGSGDKFGLECGSNCKPPATEIGPWRCDETVDS